MVEHGYTAEEIHVRLRHSKEIIEMIIANHEKMKREKQ